MPEGLKALFRPMTVMVPDLVLICENMLMAQVLTQRLFPNVSELQVRVDGVEVAVGASAAAS